jgi:glucose-6-phosphate 1-dehydrogenase
MEPNKVSVLVIFGATGDLAKLETFPALVSLVDRGVLDVPIVGVAKNGWGLEQFRWVSGWRWLTGRQPGGACVAR